MAREDPRPVSWWQTLPGVMTGIAALLTALTGLQNNQAHDANFWDSSFRLVAHDNVIAASGGLNQVIEGGSFSAEQKVVFVVPKDSRVGALRITNAGESTELPLIVQ